MQTHTNIILQVSRDRTQDHNFITENKTNTDWNPEDEWQTFVKRNKTEIKSWIIFKEDARVGIQTWPMATMHVR